MKPFLKWVGGKTQILDKVLEQFPKEMEEYHEPFLGGGSVLLGLLSSDIKVGKVYASDINEGLIYLYKNVQSNVETLLVEVQVLLDAYSNCVGTTINRKELTSDPSQETYYYWIRRRFNVVDKTTVEGSAMFLFLNKTCFRGLYREGPHGFNVPYGNYKKVTMDADHLRAVSQLIQNVIFTAEPFQKAFDKIIGNKIIGYKIIGNKIFTYLDPPYAPLNSTSFVSYQANGFSLEDHQELFQLCKKVSFVMSNADVPLVRESFPNYPVTVLSCRRAIHSKSPESRTNELLMESWRKDSRTGPP